MVRAGGSRAPPRRGRFGSQPKRPPPPRVGGGCARRAALRPFLCFLARPHFHQGLSMCFPDAPGLTDTAVQSATLRVDWPHGIACPSRRILPYGFHSFPGEASPGCSRPREGLLRRPATWATPYGGPLVRQQLQFLPRQTTVHMPTGHSESPAHRAAS